VYIGILLNKKFWEDIITFFPSYDRDHIENNVSNNSYVVAMAVTGDRHTNTQTNKKDL
jgi:hypothetical protein